MSDPELAEKIEQIRDMLVRKAESKNRPDDFENYPVLRSQLLEDDHLKRALPKYVRTCAELNEFWTYLKREHADLTSYDKRRIKIWADFKPLVDAFQGDQPFDVDQFIPKGAQHDAYTLIRSILQKAKRSLLIIDGYMDSTMFVVLSTLIGNLSIRLLTMKPPPDFGLEGSKFMQQHGTIRLEARKTKDFHDRFIILDGKEVYLLGASIKDAGAKICSVTQVKNPIFVKALLENAEQVWDAATVVFAPS